MNKLNSSQRSYLRSQAHHLEPVVLIGKNGLTEGANKLINNALRARELIKIKFCEYKDEKQSLSEQIAEETESQVVGIIGHTVIRFRQNPDSEKQHFQLIDY